MGLNKTVYYDRATLGHRMVELFPFQSKQCQGEGLNTLIID